MCHICERGFTQKKISNSHLCIHTGEKSFLCRMCQKGFAQRSSLYRHFQTHTSDKNAESVYNKEHVLMLIDKSVASDGNIEEMSNDNIFI